MFQLLYKIYNKSKKLILKFCYRNVQWKENENYIVTGLISKKNNLRIPINNKKKKNWSKEFRGNNICNPGAKIQFIANAKEIKMNIILSECINMPHMSRNGTSGIEIYEWIDEVKKWHGCFTPKNIFSTKIIISIKPDRDNSRFEVVLPSFSQVLNVEIEGVNGNIQKCNYPYERKIAIYGSSITQGCASSRPSLSFANLIGDNLNAEIFNFGFSGSAHGELEIAEQIGKMNLDAIVMEYDHNAEVEELRNTHWIFYKKIRQYTSVPIIMLSRLSGGISNTEEEQKKRDRIIRNTYEMAYSNGDRNIFVIYGKELLSKEQKMLYFADDRHPNDMGMFVIANAISEKLREALNL